MSHEIWIPMNVLRVQRHCDCGGIFESDGLCLTTSPSQFPHKCTHCGLTETFSETYPYLKYIAINTLFIPSDLTDLVDLTPGGD